MIPGNGLSNPALPLPFLYPKDIDTDSTFAYELGGIALSDSSQGLQIQAWKVEIVPIGDGSTANAVISSATQLPLVLFNLPDFTEISLAFDQNMKPFVAYVSQGNPGFYWYDATLPGDRFTALPPNSTTPRCTLDDDRALEISSGRSDIIIAYILSNNLVFRMERDRYTIEYVLYNNLNLVPITNASLNRIGMDTGYRLQFFLTGGLYG